MCPPSSLKHFALLVVVSLLAAEVCVGQSVDEVHPSLIEGGQKYSITFDGSDTEFEMNPTPLLRWSNPIVMDQRGAVFVWMASGRPQTIGCCFHELANDSEKQIHEFHSLATKPLRARRDGKEIWHPRKTLEFSVVPNAPQPAAAPSGRDVQMRQIARRFAAQMKRDNGDQTELRLISRPVLTYQPRTNQCIDGAIFSFAAGGTDPDAFLLIENRPVDEGSAWHYALARFHFNEITAQLDRANVWTADAKPRLANNYLGSRTFRDDVYIVFRVR